MVINNFALSMFVMETVCVKRAYGEILSRYAGHLVHVGDRMRLVFVLGLDHSMYTLCVSNKNACTTYNVQYLHISPTLSLKLQYRIITAVNNTSSACNTMSF